MCVALLLSREKSAGIPLLPSGILRKTVSPISGAASSRISTTRFVSPAFETWRVAGTVKSVLCIAEVSSPITSTDRLKELAGAAETVTGTACIVTPSPSTTFDSADAKPTVPDVPSSSMTVNRCVPRVVLRVKPDGTVSVTVKDLSISATASSVVGMSNCTKSSLAAMVAVPLLLAMSPVPFATSQSSETAALRSLPETSTRSVIESPSSTVVGLFGANDTVPGAGSSTVNSKSVVARPQPIEFTVEWNSGPSEKATVYLFSLLSPSAVKLKRTFAAPDSEDIGIV